MAASPDSTPLPKTITGGCLCAAVRWQVDFPSDHDFASNSSACQCTQCRKQTGSLFWSAFRVPLSAVRWTPAAVGGGSGSPPASLKTYRASPGAERGFCGACGSVVFWKPKGRDTVTLSVGGIDALYLFGEGADRTENANAEVPEHGFGSVICTKKGLVEWCQNEIKGVTDDMPLLLEGTRNQQDPPETNTVKSHL